MIRAALHFGHSPPDRLLEWHRYKKHLERARQQHEKRKDHDIDEADTDLVSTIATVASSEQLSAFSSRLDEFDDKLDAYHEASLEALMEADIQLDKVREELKRVRRELDIMRESAFELEDGTRIFLSEDETWAIDAEGNEVDIAHIPIDSVPPEAKIAESFAEKLDAEDRLQTQEKALVQRIEDIHEFDSKRAQYAERSEEMREKIQGGDVSSKELEALEAELEAMDSELQELMPPSVRSRLEGPSREIGSPERKSDLLSGQSQIEISGPAPMTPAI